MVRHIRVAISHPFIEILPFLDHAAGTESVYHHDGVMASPFRECHGLHERADAWPIDGI